LGELKNNPFFPASIAIETWFFWLFIAVFILLLIALGLVVRMRLISRI
jgi:hypothetical protein